MARGRLTISTDDESSESSLSSVKRRMRDERIKRVLTAAGAVAPSVLWLLRKELKDRKAIRALTKR